MLLIILQTHCQFILSRIILRSVKCCSSFRTSPVARHVQCQEKWRRRCISLNQARQSVFARWSLNLGKIKRLQSRRTGYGSSYQVRWLIPDQRGSRIRGNLWVSSWSNETKVMLIGLIYGSSKADRHRWRSGGSTGNQLSGEEQRRPQGAVWGHAELQGTQHRARPLPKGLCVLTAPVTTKSVVPAPMFRAGVSLVVCLPRSRARRAGGAFVTNIHSLWDRAWPVCGLEPYGRMLFVNMGASGKQGIVLNSAKAVCPQVAPWSSVWERSVLAGEATLSDGFRLCRTESGHAAPAPLLTAFCERRWKEIYSFWNCRTNSCASQPHIPILMEALHRCLSTRAAKRLALSAAFHAAAEAERQSEKFPAPYFPPADAARRQSALPHRQRAGEARRAPWGAGRPRRAARWQQSPGNGGQRLRARLRVMERRRRSRGAEGCGGRLKEGFFINRNRSPRAVPTLSSPHTSRTPLETAPRPSAEQPPRGSGHLVGGSGHGGILPPPRVAT